MSAPSQRQLRVGELIRRALSEILAGGDLHDPDLDRTSITVGEVRTSPDLRQATAYVLPLGGEGAEAVLAALRRHKGEIRHRLAGRVDLRRVPDLRFALDESFDRLDEARRLFADPRIRRDVAEGSGE
jgi:ribosome-binding factor A